MERLADRETTRITELRGQLRALSPQGTLDRGYAIVQNAAGHVIGTPSEAPEGAVVRVTVAGGAFAAMAGERLASPATDAGTDPAGDPAGAQRDK